MRSLLLWLAVTLLACKKDEPAARPAPADAVVALDAAPVVRAPDADPWRTYPVGDAHVKSPVPPEQTQVDVPADTGTVPATQYVFEPGGDGMFAAMVVSNPPDLGKTVEQILADSRDGMMELYGATVLGDQAVMLDGTPGRDILFRGDIPDLGAIHGHAIVFVHRDRTYSAVYLALGTGTGRDPVGERFIASFRFAPP